MVFIRNALFACFALSIMGIWSDEISTFALSMVALAAATVVATKEFILSLLSTMFNVGQFGVRVGDTIRIGDKRGRVVDFSPMNIRLMELDESSLGYTGKEMIFPSSVLATQSIEREMIVDGFSMRIIKFQSTVTESLDDEEMILDIASKVCEPFRNDAQVAWKAYSEQESLEGVGVKPKTTITIPTRTKPDDIVIDIHLRFAAPVKTAFKIEQEIIRQFLKAKASQIQA